MKWTKRNFEALYRRYSDEKWIESDPLQFCFGCSDPSEAELKGFVSSLFAYGNVTAMKAFLSGVFSSRIPFNADSIAGRKLNLKTYYRFQTQSDINTFFSVLREVLRSRWSGRGSIFENLTDQENPDLKSRIDAVRTLFWKEAPQQRQTRGYRHLIGYGTDNSARKRYCMFFRWMTRTGFPDLGLYKTVNPSGLIIPLDTHIIKISGILGLRSRKTPDWKTATEITENLRSINPVDPLKYDFALTRPGILRDKNFRI